MKMNEEYLKIRGLLKVNDVLKIKERKRKKK
jgi:hypothetical protein